MKLNFKELGEGKPLIILHGLFGSLDNWYTLAKVFAERFHVYLVDQRNHGGSPHADEFDYQVMADDIKEFIDTHHIHDPHLLGHSMGGKTAMQFAMNHPDLWDKMIVVDIAPKAYPVHHAAILQGLQSLELSGLTSRGAADKQLERDIPDFGTRQFLLKNLDRTKEGGFRWKINLPVIAGNIEGMGKGLNNGMVIDKEVLFIRGSKSDYIRDEDFQIINQFFSKAKVETIEAGHWVHAEKPRELVTSALGFLD